MSSVDTAADYASKLLRSEARGPGDTTGAMQRIETKYGVPYWTQWALRYRRPKSVTVEVFQQIRSAYLAVCERQAAALSHDLALEQAKSGDDDLSDLVAEVEGLLAKIKAKKSSRDG